MLNLQPYFMQFTKNLGEEFKHLNFRTRCEGGWDHKEAVMRMIPYHWNSLKYVSPRMRGDRDVMYLAMRLNHDAAQFAAPSLLNDRDFIMSIVKESGLLFTSPTIQERWGNDYEMCLAAVDDTGYALQCLPAGSPFRDDERILRTALKTNASALHDASEAQRSNRGLVLYAVSRAGDSFRNASESLRGDKAFVLEVIKTSNDRYCLWSMKRELRFDKDVVIAMIRRWDLSGKYHFNAIMSYKHSESGKRLFEDLHVQLAQARHQSPTKALKVVRSIRNLSDNWQEDELAIDLAIELLNFWTDKKNKVVQALNTAVERLVKDIEHPVRGAGGKRNRDDFEADFI